MAIKYVPYPVRALEGQAVLDNFVRTPPSAALS